MKAVGQAGVDEGECFTIAPGAVVIDVERVDCRRILEIETTESISRAGIGDVAAVVPLVVGSESVKSASIEALGIRKRTPCRRSGKRRYLLCF